MSLHSGGKIRVLMFGFCSRECIDQRWDPNLEWECVCGGGGGVINNCLQSAACCSNISFPVPGWICRKQAPHIKSAARPPVFAL